jgi:hypothetical protein
MSMFQAKRRSGGSGPDDAHKILPLRDFLLTVLPSIPNTKVRFGDAPFSPVRGHK